MTTSTSTLQANGAPAQLSSLTLSAPKTLLMGATGTGKTHALRTYLDVSENTKLFAIYTEPNGPEVNADLPRDRYHFRYIPAVAPNWDKMIDLAKKIHTLSFESLAKFQDPDRKIYTEFVDLLTCLSNFKCDCCGREWGPVDKFPIRATLALDSLSGVNPMAMNLVVGGKPVKAPGDWAVAMSAINNLITRLTAISCPVCVTAHVERETDETTGAMTLMASTLGRKLAPVLPRFFSDVIMTKRDGAKYTWTTAAVGVDLKSRNLPLAEGIEPSFKQILTRWAGRNGYIF